MAVDLSTALSIKVGDLVCWVPRIGKPVHGCCGALAGNTFPPPPPEVVVGRVKAMQEQSIIQLEDFEHKLWDPSVCSGYIFVPTERTLLKYMSRFEG